MLMPLYGLTITGVVIRWKIPCLPPANYYLGGMLRGILGHALAGEVCTYSVTQCHDCLKNVYCYYPSIFKSIDSEQLSPYVLHQWSFDKGSVSVTIFLINHAYYGIEHWIRGLKSQLPLLEWCGQKGMRLLSVHDWQTREPVFQHNRFVTSARITSVETLPSIKDQQQIRFASPLLSKHQHDDPLFAALRTRLQRLRLQFGDKQRFELTSNLAWQSRQLKKSHIVLKLGDKHRAISAYYYDLQLTHISDEAKKMLALGSLLHVGGQTSFGLGRYVCAH